MPIEQGQRETETGALVPVWRAAPVRRVVGPWRDTVSADWRSYGPWRETEKAALLDSLPESPPPERGAASYFLDRACLDAMTFNKRERTVRIKHRPSCFCEPRFTEALSG